MHATEVIGRIAKHGVRGPNQSAGDVAKGPMAFAALRRQDCRVDCRARSPDAHTHAMTRQGTAAFSFAQRSAEVLLTPAHHHAHDGTAKTAPVGRVSAGSAARTTARRAHENGEATITNDAGDGLRSLPLPVLQQMQQLKRMAERSANSAPTDDTTTIVSADASVMEGRQQVAAQHCELHPPTPWKLHHDGPLERRRTAPEQMQQLLVTARSQRAPDDEEEPSMLLWMHSAENSDRHDDADHWTEPPGWCLHRMYMNPNHADLRHVHLELAVKGQGRPERLNEAVVRNLMSSRSRGLSMTLLTFAQWDVDCDATT